MASTLQTAGRNLSEALFILPFMVLPLIMISPSPTAPASSKQGVRLFVTLQRGAMR